MTLQIFYRSFYRFKKIVAENAIRGSLISQTFRVTLRLLDKMTKKSRA